MHSLCVMGRVKASSPSLCYPFLIAFFYYIMEGVFKDVYLMV